MLPDPHGANKAQLLMIRLAQDSGEHDSLSIADWADIELGVTCQGYRRWFLTMDDDSSLDINPIPASYGFDWVYAVAYDPATDSVSPHPGRLHYRPCCTTPAPGCSSSKAGKDMISVDEFKKPALTRGLRPAPRGRPQTSHATIPAPKEIKP